MREVLIVVLLTSALFVNGQNKIDSLKTELSKPNLPDTLVIQMLNHLGWYYRASHLDSTSFYCDSALNYSQRVGYDFGVATANNYLGIVNTISGDYKNAVLFYHEAIKFFRKINDPVEVANTLSNKAIVFELQGSLDSAIFYTTKGLRMREQAKDTSGMRKSFINLGVNYYNKGFYLLSLDYYMKALDIMSDSDDYLSVLFLNIGAINFELENLDLAIEYYRKGLKLAKNQNNKRNLAEFNRNIGSYYYRLNRVDSSITYFKNGIEYARQINYKSAICNISYGLAVSYLEMNQIDIAKEYIDSAKILAREFNEKQCLCELLLIESKYFQKKENHKLAEQNLLTSLQLVQTGIYGKLYQQLLGETSAYYSSVGDYKQANLFLLKQKSVLDSLQGIQVKNKVTEIEIKYKTEKKQQQIELLETNALLADAKAKQDEQVRYFMITCLALLTVAIIIFYFQYKRLQQGKRIIQLQKEDKDQLYSSLSHNLKSPIDSIVALFGQMIKSLGSKFSKSELFNLENSMTASISVQRMMGNIMSIANFENMYAGKTLQEVFLSDVINEVVNLYGIERKIKGVGIVLECSKDVSIQTNLVAFKLSVQNLIANAINYAESSSEVSISVTQSDDEILIQVSNYAQKNDLDRVEEFVQGTNILKHPDGSRSTGLRSVEQMMKVINGKSKFEIHTNSVNVSLILPNNKSDLAA